MKRNTPWVVGLMATALLGGCALQPASSGPPVALTTSTVRIVGSNARLEKSAVEEHVGYWTNVDTHAEWPLHAVNPGTYRVDVVYAQDPRFSGATIAVSAAGQTLTATLPPTESWHDYHPLTLGSIKIGNPPDTVLTVKATSMPQRYVMNLQQIILTPIGN